MNKIAPLLFILFASCANNKRGEVGQYVYVDCFNTIHIDRDCAANIADNPKTKEERIANMQGVEFIDTCNLTAYKSEPPYPVTTGASYKYCPKCVNDEAFKHIAKIMERNTVKPPAY